MKEVAFGVGIIQMQSLDGFYYIIRCSECKQLIVDIGTPSQHASQALYHA